MFAVNPPNDRKVIAMDFITELQWRGLIKDVTDVNLLGQLLEKKATLYCGFDPTADSLHIGHLVPIQMLMRFQRHGHRIIALVGGGTGLIGDPSGRKNERQLLTLEQSLKNAESIKLQLSQFLDFSDSNRTIMVNNYDWLHKISVIDYLRDFGKSFSINYMLAKDVVASRLQDGISYTEFSYMILQSLDFLNLYEREHCELQIGGSDQWGNITAGVELVRKSKEATVCGLTLPLITKSDGTKFGKSSSGSFWLDANRTSPYEIYQYFLNTADADVVHYLKVFTFLSPEEIMELEKTVIEVPEQRLAQRRLAEEMIRIMHGEQALLEAQKMTSVLFGGNVRDLTASQLQICLQGVSSIQVNNPVNIIDALVELKAASSRREARELLAKGTYSLNGEKIDDSSLMLSQANAIDNKLFVLRRGKKNYFLVQYIQ